MPLILSQAGRGVGGNPGAAAKRLHHGTEFETRYRNISGDPAGAATRRAAAPW